MERRSDTSPADSVPPSDPAGSPPPSLQSATAPAGPMICAADPGVETYLRCARCEKPICPKCLIQTPVGSRCRDCADLRRPPMFDIKPMGYARAVGAGIGAGIGGSLLLTLVQSMVPFAGFFGFMLMAGLGYLIGEAVSVAVRRKQGNALGVIAALSVFLGLIVVRAGLLMVAGAPPLLAFSAGAASIAAPLWNALGVLLAAGVAYSRAR